MEYYEKIKVLFQLAMDMQSSREGLSLKDIQGRCDCSRRTAERMRNALLEIFPNIEETETWERVKRWRMPQQNLRGFISFSYEELTAFKLAINILEQHNLQNETDILKGMENKLRGMMKIKR